MLWSSGYPSGKGQKAGRERQSLKTRPCSAWRCSHFCSSSTCSFPGPSQCLLHPQKRKIETLFRYLNYHLGGWMTCWWRENCLGYLLFLVETAWRNYVNDLLEAEHLVSMIRRVPNGALWKPGVQTRWTHQTLRKHAHQAAPAGKTF